MMKQIIGKVMRELFFKTYEVERVPEILAAKENLRDYFLAHKEKSWVVLESIGEKYMDHLAIFELQESVKAFRAKKVKAEYPRNETLCGRDREREQTRCF